MHQLLLLAERDRPKYNTPSPHQNGSHVKRLLVIVWKDFLADPLQSQQHQCFTTVPPERRVAYAPLTRSIDMTGTGYLPELLIQAAATFWDSAWFWTDLLGTFSSRRLTPVVGMPKPSDLFEMLKRMLQWFAFLRSTSRKPQSLWPVITLLRHDLLDWTDVWKDLCGEELHRRCLDHRRRLCVPEWCREGFDLWPQHSGGSGRNQAGSPEDGPDGHPNHDDILLPVFLGMFSFGSSLTSYGNTNHNDIT